MTEIFRATDGTHVDVHDSGSRIDIKCTGSSGEQHFLSVKETQAAREFFQHERDKDLGRWRWPENPDYVVMDDGLNFVKILHEPSMETTTWERGWKDTRSVADEAGVAYFEAHPERKPWEDAKQGEAWELTFSETGGGGTEPWIVHKGTFRDPDYVNHVPLNDSTITDGRRIWPEGDAS